MNAVRLALASLLTVALVTIPCLLLPGCSEAYAQSGPQLRRGISIHQAFNWPTVTADSTAYVWPPFDEPRHQVPDERIQKVAQAGFDFVRLTLDPGPFMEFDADKRSALEAKLFAFIRKLRSAGLDVLLDVSPIELHPGYTWDKFVQDPETPFMVRYFDFLARMSAQLAQIAPGHVAIEPLNEPQTGYDPTTQKRWQAITERSHAAVRSVSPDLQVVLTGAMAGSIDGLLVLDPKPFRGSNVRYSIHFYEPFEFTHQSLQPGAGKFMTGLPFPAAKADLNAYLPVVEKRIRESGLAPDVQINLLFDARSKLRVYFETKADVGRIDRRLGEVTSWTTTNQIAPERILVGEFGAMRPDFNGAPQADRVNYVRAVREAAERKRFGWALWVLDWSEMGLVLTRGGTDLDPDILGALGLKQE